MHHDLWVGRLQAILICMKKEFVDNTIENLFVLKSFFFRSKDCKYKEVIKIKTPGNIPDPRTVLIFVSLSNVPFTSKVSMFDELRSTFLAKLKKVIELLFEITFEVYSLCKRFFY